MLSDVFDCFWLLFWSPNCLKSSGRLLGSISSKFRANPRSYDQKYCFWIFDFQFFFVFLAVILVPELFKKLRETPGNNFHQVSCKSEELWPRISCDLMLRWDHRGGTWSPDFKLGKRDRIFPGASRSFLNSSGTNTTAKNHREMKLKLPTKSKDS